MLPEWLSICQFYFRKEWIFITRGAYSVIRGHLQQIRGHKQFSPVDFYPRAAREHSVPSVPLPRCPPLRGLQWRDACSSVFMKRTKKLDPAIAKQREERKRKKLTREIRLMQQHSKKPKPLDEMYIDIVSARNLRYCMFNSSLLSELWS